MPVCPLPCTPATARSFWLPPLRIGSSFTHTPPPSLPFIARVSVNNTLGSVSSYYRGSGSLVNLRALPYPSPRAAVPYFIIALLVVSTLPRCMVRAPLVLIVTLLLLVVRFFSSPFIALYLKLTFPLLRLIDDIFLTLLVLGSSGSYNLCYLPTPSPPSRCVATLTLHHLYLVVWFIPVLLIIDAFGSLITICICPAQRFCLLPLPLPCLCTPVDPVLALVG